MSFSKALVTIVDVCFAETTIDRLNFSGISNFGLRFDLVSSNMFCSRTLRFEVHRCQLRSNLGPNNIVFATFLHKILVPSALVVDSRPKYQTIKNTPKDEPNIQKIQVPIRPRSWGQVLTRGQQLVVSDFPIVGPENTLTQTMEQNAQGQGRSRADSGAGSGSEFQVWPPVAILDQRWQVGWCFFFGFREVPFFGATMSRGIFVPVLAAFLRTKRAAIRGQKLSLSLYGVRFLFMGTVIFLASGFV